MKKKKRVCRVVVVVVVMWIGIFRGIGLVRKLGWEDRWLWLLGWRLLARAFGGRACRRAFGLLRRRWGGDRRSRGSRGLSGIAVCVDVD